MDCAKFFQFNSFQRGNIIEVGQTVFCWLKPAPLALWLSEAQVHRSYRNDPKFSDRQVWANSVDPDQTADQHLDCLPFCIFWTHYSMVKQPCPNFRVITANVWMSELLGVLRYTTSITLSLVSELISVSYPNYVRLRVKCIEGVLTSHLGSNLDPYYNQNRVLTNNVIKRFSCTRIT